MPNPFGFAVAVSPQQQQQYKNANNGAFAPFGFVPPKSKAERIGEILKPYVTGPFDAFNSLMNSPFALGFDPTEQDAANGLAAAGGAMMAGSVVPKPANALNMGIRAFHGSPHSFDKFDMSKIGTGEGAQAYGHGLYFAENEGVAKGYRDALSRQTSYDGRSISDMHPSDSDTAQAIHSIAKHVADGVDPKTAMLDEAAKWRQAAEPYVKFGKENPEHADRAMESAKSFMAVADAIEKLDPNKFVKNPGSMYEVNINADPNAFLDWDKPLSEQPEAVRKAIEANNLAPKSADLGSFAGSPIQSAPRWADTPEEAAKLREAGIPGIKYLDAGSRGKGVAAVQPIYKGQPYGDPVPAHAWNQVDQLTQRYKDMGYDVEVQDLGTRNYVVFDDKLIEIVRKYGIAGASAMLGYNILDGMDSAQADELKRIEGNQ